MAFFLLSSDSEGILRGFGVEFGMLFLDVRSPHFCIIRFYHIEIRFDEKDGDSYDGS